MTHKLDVELSPELEVYRARIEATVKPYVEIKLTDNAQPTWWQSKFGGVPYLPKGFECPKTVNGEYLYLLAQINFAEVPNLKDFPDKGILQFYLVADEDCYGLDFENPQLQNNFRVIYFADLELSEENLVTDFSFLPSIKKDELLMPFEGCCGLDFQQKFGAISIHDYRFDLFDLYADEFQNIYEEYWDKLSLQGHKLGGYPNFTQNDPREEIPQAHEYILLLQMDTDSNDTIDICWGDAGIGNFFIKRSDLLRCDFSQVLYNWDCG